MSKRSKITKQDDGTLVGLFMNTDCGDHIPRGTTGDVEIVKKGPVMVVDRYESLPRVFRKLTTEGFLGAPVCENGRYVGFIDMMDLVLKTRNLFWGDSEELWVDFWEKEDLFQMTTVDDIMSTPNTYARDPSPPITSDFTTFSALELMVRHKHHRLAVLKPNSSKMDTILTHSMLISWIRQNKSKLGTLREETVRNIVEEEEGKRPLLTIKDSQKAINAFNKMASEKVQGLAVVDDDGLLVGGISIRDLRDVGASGENFYRLFHTIKEFKKQARDDYPRLAPRTHYSNKLVPRRALYVLPTDNFEDVINKMYDGNIHRVFVCESTVRPIPVAVITQLDMLRHVLEHCKREAALCEVGSSYVA